jgi:hypothetical protein
MAITITDIKIVGLCSKHRKSDEDILRFKDGSIVEDKDIACIEEAFGEK